MATNVIFSVKWNFSFRENKGQGKTTYYRDKVDVVIPVPMFAIFVKCIEQYWISAI